MFRGTYDERVNALCAAIENAESEHDMQEYDRLCAEYDQLEKSPEVPVFPFYLDPKPRGREKERSFKPYASLWFDQKTLCTLSPFCLHEKSCQNLPTAFYIWMSMRKQPLL